MLFVVRCELVVVCSFLCVAYFLFFGVRVVRCVLCVTCL